MMYTSKENRVHVFTDGKEQLYLTVHQTEGNPVPVERQASILADLLNREFSIKESS